METIGELILPWLASFAVAKAQRARRTLRRAKREPRTVQVSFSVPRVHALYLAWAQGTRALTAVGNVRSISRQGRRITSLKMHVVALRAHLAHPVWHEVKRLMEPAARKIALRIFEKRECVRLSRTIDKAEDNIADILRQHHDRTMVAAYLWTYLHRQALNYRHPSARILGKLFELLETLKEALLEAASYTATHHSPDLYWLQLDVRGTYWNFYLKTLYRVHPALHVLALRK